MANLSFTNWQVCAHPLIAQVATSAVPQEHAMNVNVCLSALLLHGERTAQLCTTIKEIFRKRPRRRRFKSTLGQFKRMSRREENFNRKERTALHGIRNLDS